MLKDLQQRILHMVKTGTITNTVDTSGSVQTCQISTFQGQEVHNDRPMYGTWGLTSVPPVNSQAITLSGYGLNNNRFVVGTHDVNTHPKNLKQGEVQLYDTQAQCVYLQDQTAINITANNIVRITVNGTEVCSIKDGSVYVQGNLLVSTGASGSFSDQNGKVVIVQAGIITSIN